MITHPFKTGQKSTPTEAWIREISRTSQTSGKFPGNLGTESMDDTESKNQVGNPTLARLEAAFGMVVTGTTLMAATPPRPGKHLMHRRRRGPDQSSEQTTHFGNGQGQCRKFSARARASRSISAETLRGANPCQVGMCQQNQRHMAIPADPTSDLIVVQAQIFPVFKILLHVPSRPDRFDHLLQGGS